MTTITAAAPGIVRAGSLRDSIQRRAAHLRDRRRALERRPRRRLARRRRWWPRSARCCCSTGCCSSATRTSRAPSTSPSRATSASWRTTRSPAATRSTRAWCGSTSRPTRPNDRYENSWHTDATWREKPPFGCVLRCVECPPVGGDTMWANMALAYERLPEHIKTQIAPPARAPQHRGQLRRGDADREAPRAARAVPRCRAPGRAHPSRDRREGAVRQRLHDALHQLPQRRPTCATARTTRRARRSCCST